MVFHSELTMDEDHTPALPWGQSSGNASNIGIDRDLPARLKLAIGSAKVEVKWMLCTDSEGEDNADATVVTKVIESFWIANFEFWAQISLLISFKNNHYKHQL